MISFITFLIGLMMTLWLLRWLPVINMDAAINLYFNLLDMYERACKKLEEIEDEIKKEERAKKIKDGSTE